MDYSYTPGSPEDEEQKRQKALAAQQQPDATTPDPSADADPFQRNVTAVEGNPESRYGGVQTPAPAAPITPIGSPSLAPTRNAQPDAFDRPVQPQLLVPSPAVSNVTPTTPAIGAPAPTLTAAPAVPPQPVPVPGSPTINPNPAIGGPSPAVNPLAAAAPPALTTSAAVPPPSAPVSPFPGTLPGSTPQANAQPVQPRDIIPDDEDAFRQRRRPAY